MTIISISQTTVHVQEKGTCLLLLRYSNIYQGKCIRKKIQIHNPAPKFPQLQYETLRLKKIQNYRRFKSEVYFVFSCFTKWMSIAGFNVKILTTVKAASPRWNDSFAVRWIQLRTLHILTSWLIS